VIVRAEAEANTSGSEDAIGLPTVVLADRVVEQVLPQVSSIVRDKVDPDSVNTGASFTSVTEMVTVLTVTCPPPSVARTSNEKDFWLESSKFKS
jgi:hypothetical protein